MNILSRSRIQNQDETITLPAFGSSTSHMSTLWMTLAAHEHANLCGGRGEVAE